MSAEPRDRTDKDAQDGIMTRNNLTVQVNGKDRPMVLEIYCDDAGVSTIRHDLDAAGVPGRHALEQWPLVLAAAVELVAEQSYGGSEEGGSLQLTLELMERVADGILGRISRMEDEMDPLMRPAAHHSQEGEPDGTEGEAPGDGRRPARNHEWIDYDHGLDEAVRLMLADIPAPILSGIIDCLDRSATMEIRPYAIRAYRDMKAAISRIDNSRATEPVEVSIDDPDFLLELQGMGGDPDPVESTDADWSRDGF